MSKLKNLTCGADKEFTGKIALLKSEKDLVLEPIGDRGSFGDKLFSVGEVGVETFLKYLCCKSSASKDSKISCWEFIVFCFNIFHEWWEKCQRVINQ